MSLTDKNLSKSNVLTANDWVEIAEYELAKAGISAVRVEPLAKKLKVTKGSFYWHFSGRQELFQKILTNWRTRSTNAIIERLSDSDLSHKAQLKQLFLIPQKNSKQNHAAALERAIRNWSQSDSNVTKTTKEVDNHRLKFISGNFEKLGYSKQKATLKAACFYYTMQGVRAVGIDDSDTHLEEIFELLL